MLRRSLHIFARPVAPKLFPSRSSACAAAAIVGSISSKTELSNAQRLVQNHLNTNNGSLHEVTTALTHCTNKSLLSAIAVAGRQIAEQQQQNPRAAGTGAKHGKSRIEIMSELSKIKSLAEFAQFHDGDSDAFERAAALGIAAGFDGHVKVCVLQRQIGWKKDKCTSAVGRRHRSHADKYFEELSSQMKAILKQNGRVVLVNAPAAEFADVIVLSPGAVGLVQTKNVSRGMTVETSGEKIWSGSSGKSRRVLHRFIGSVYANTAAVNISFSFLLRAGQFAHRWPKYFQRWRRSDRSCFLVHEHVGISGASSFIVDSYCGFFKEAERHFPSTVNFNMFARRCNSPAALPLLPSLIQLRPENLQHLAAAASRQVEAPLLAQVDAAGEACRSLLCVNTSRLEAQLEILPESKIKSLAEFSHFSGDSDSFERAVALGIARQLGGVVAVAVLGRQWDNRGHVRELFRSCSMWYRRRLDDYFDTLFADVRSRLGRGEKVVLVNAGSASFADIMVLTDSAVMVVQVKNFILSDPGSSPHSHIWAGLGSHSSSPQRRCLDKLIRSIYKNPQRIKRIFTLVIRSDTYPHLWPKWFSRTCNRGDNANRHLLLIRPNRSKLGEYELEHHTSK